MSGKRGDVTLRIGAEDVGAKQTINQFTAESKKAMAEANAAFERPGPGLRALNAGMGRLNDEAAMMAQRVPLVGGALGGLKGSTLLLAGAVGAAAVGLAKARDIAKQAVIEFDRLGKAAADLSLSTDTFQGLSFGGLTAGVDQARWEAALRMFQTRAADAARGVGELVTRLKDLDPELARSIGSAGTMEERLRLVAAAIGAATDETERQTIAVAAFGEQGAAVARMIADYNGSIDEMIAAAREAGVVVDAELIAGAEELQTRIDTLSRAIDLKLKQAFIGLAPQIEGTLELMDKLATFTRDVVESFQDLEDMGSGALERRIEALTREVNLHRSLAERSPAFLRGGHERAVEEATRQLAEATEQLLELRRAAHEAAAAGGEMMGASFQAAAEEVDKAVKTINPAFEYAARVREALMTADERLAAEERALTEAVKAGALTDKEAKEFLAQRRAELTETGEEVERLRLSELALEEVLLGQIDSWEDVGEVATRVLKRIVLEHIRARAEIGSGFGDFLAGLGGDIFGSIFGRGIGAAKTPPIMPGKVPVKKSHEGEAFVSSVTGRPHAGPLGPREHVRILEEGERVLSVPDNRALIAAVREAGRGGGAPAAVVVEPKVEVRVDPSLGPVDANARTGEVDPRTGLRRVVVDIVRSAIRRGEVTSDMRAAFGVRELPGRR